MLTRIKRYRFLFEELVKRDFTKKYKNTVLGIVWSILGPLLTLLVMAVVFIEFFGRNTPHYIIYLFCGNLVFGYYRESTNAGMMSLYRNSDIFSKVNVPKYMFLLSMNVSSLINFLLNLVVLFLFVAIDGIAFSWKFLLLVYPIGCLLLFNLGVGLILSAIYLMFKDMTYIYNIFTTLLMYLSAIFYPTTTFSPTGQALFYFNPVYIYIRYFRCIIIDGQVPSLGLHVLSAAYAAVALLIGALIYKKMNYKFLYYI